MKFLHLFLNMCVCYRPNITCLLILFIPAVLHIAKEICTTDGYAVWLDTSY